MAVLNNQLPLVVGGTYEHQVFGLEVHHYLDAPDNQWTLNPVFAFEAHSGCVKAVATSDSYPYMTSGSADASIK